MSNVPIAVRLTRVILFGACAVCVCGAFGWTVQGIWGGAAAYLALTMTRTQ